MSSIVSCGIDGLRPRPLRTWPNRAIPSSANRARQFATEAGDTDHACAIAELASPCDAINNALARTTSRWAPDCDRATDSNNSRCPAQISNAATGFLMEGSYRTKPQLFARHTTSPLIVDDPRRGGRDDRPR